MLALPIGLAAARNLMPPWVTLARARRSSSLARSFHPVIVAILFVKAVGFGALAGILALTVASIGFIGKLFTEAIEEISLKQVEAVRATGAPFASVLAFGVLPQVFSRFIGFATYQLDSNLRNSTMVGIVGAGGIGGTLFAAFQRFDYDFVCAILISIIALIMVGEVLATARARDLHRQRDARATSSARGAMRASGTPRTTDGRRRRRCRTRPPIASGAASRRRSASRASSSTSSIVAAIVASVRTVEVIPEFLVRRARAGRRPADADVADRLAALPGRRARRADRDDPHRVARHAARAACWRCRSACSPRTTSCRSRRSTCSRS